MDATIRRDFCAAVVAPLLDKVGPGNVYGAHLLEETGMQFGVDLDVPGDPSDLTDGDDNGSNWDQPSWLGYGGVAGYIGGPYVPNIRRYNDHFRKETGLDMREAALWAYTGGWQVYRAWVSRRLEAGAAVAFADYLHRHYPRIKAFTWDAVGWGQAGVSDMRTMKGKLDGLIMDPYSKAGGIFAAVRAPRLIDANIEIIAVLWGCDDKPEGEMLNRAAAAYAGGADVVCFFGDTSHEADATWQQRLGQFAAFTRLPPYDIRTRVLLITGHASWETRFARFACFDIMSAYEADAVDLERYALVVIYEAGDLPTLRQFVRKAGRVLTDRAPQFLLDEGLVREELLSTHPQKTDLDYRPAPWWREQMRLGESYPLEMVRRSEYVPAAGNVHKDVPLLVPYGKGEICILQYPGGWHVLAPERFDGLRRLLADLARGLLLRADAAAVADSALCAPAAGGCLRVPSRRGNLVTYCLVAGHEPQPFPLKGRNLIGPDSPVLGRDVRAAVMEE
jgi:hypothetical protein